VSSHPLPQRPNLAHLKHQAKDLLKAHRAAEAQALSRIRQSLPRSHDATDDQIAGSQFQLSDALFVIAREYGFGDWPALKRHLSTGSQIPASLEPPIDLEPFKTAVKTGDANEVRRQLSQNGKLCERINDPIFEMDTPAIVTPAATERWLTSCLNSAPTSTRGQFGAAA
jgi:hypothetical protein